MDKPQSSLSYSPTFSLSTFIRTGFVVVLLAILSSGWQPSKVNAQTGPPEDTVGLKKEIHRLKKSAKDLKRSGDYDRAYFVWESAVDMSKRIADKNLMALTMSELGVICMYQGRYSDALKLMHEGVLLREMLNDSAGLAESYNYIASVHHAQTDYSIAIKYYERCLAMREKLKDAKALGILYNNLGSLYEDMGEYDKALEYHHKSMTIWKALNTDSWIAVSLRHIGICHQRKGMFNSALESFLESYDLSVKVGTRMNVIRACMPLGDLYLELNEPAKALKWCEEAYALSMEENNLYGIKESCWCLSQIHEGLNQHDQALGFYKESIKARDSIFGHDRTKELTRLEMSFVYERQQLADSLLYVKQQLQQEKKIANTRIGWASTGVVLLGIAALAVVIFRGKKRSDHLLLNILPLEIAEELKERGFAKAKRLEHVTVLFTDFKGFTNLSEQLTPEELVAEIHACFSVFDSIMEKHQVEKIKTIGDAYMAAGGVPVQNASHALDVVLAALEIQEFMKKRAEERGNSGIPYFEMRVGVHTGPVVAGIVGTKKFQYDIWGDTVNTAARMEQSGAPGMVNVSKETYELIKDKLPCTYRGKIKAKGKGEVDMYFVKSRIS